MLHRIAAKYGVRVFVGLEQVEEAAHGRSLMLWHTCRALLSKCLLPVFVLQSAGGGMAAKLQLANSRSSAGRCWQRRLPVCTA